MKNQYMFTEKELEKVELQEEREHLIECAKDESKVDEEFIRIMKKYNLFEKPERTKARINEFCVNDKEHGSVWGNIVGHEEMDSINRKSGNVIEYEGMLEDWNGKRYIFLRDDDSNKNYFIEI